MPEANCLRCISLLVGLDQLWVEGAHASYGKCVTRKKQIRKAKRNCRTFNPIDPENLPRYLEYRRAKLERIAMVLDLIEQANPEEPGQ